jgi:hypothetical protein
MYYLGLREGVLGNGGPVSFASLVCFTCNYSSCGCIRVHLQILPRSNVKP